MSYTDSLLTPGERIVRRAPQHWLILVTRSGWALFAFLIAGVLLFIRAQVSGGNPVLGALGYLTLALVVFGIATVAWAVLRFRSEEVAITSHRFIHARGVVNKRASDASLAQVTDALLSEPFLGRLLGFGDMEVRTASSLGVDHLRMVRDANGVKKALVEARHELELQLARPTMPPIRFLSPSASSPPPGTEVPPSMAPEDIVAGLRQLADQSAAGDIDPRTYEARRRELLARL
jgi:Bacterial PH domain